MSHENGLSEACKQVDQLNALLVAMDLASEKLDTTDLKTLVTLAFELACGPACWLMEEQQRRRKKNA
ncbi:hypothetical protein KH388_10180 [Serratia rubidaea]|nr:hypothetical protein [Serratia rubidaea]